MNKEQLLARAQELNIEVAEGATNNQISDLIKISEHPQLKASLKEATDLCKVITKERDQAIKALKKDSENKSKENGVTYKTESGTFEFTVKSFRFKGQKYTAEGAVEDHVLMEGLIESKSKLLKQV